MSRTGFDAREAIPRDDVARLDRQLAEAVVALEAVAWADVPGVSAVTAAAFAHQLRQARADLEADR